MLQFFIHESTYAEELQRWIREDLKKDVDAAYALEATVEILEKKKDGIWRAFDIGKKLYFTVYFTDDTKFTKMIRR